MKFLEVAGAGLASAVCAYFLGQIQIGKPAPTPGSPQQIAQVALAAGESVRVVQEAPASVVEAAPAEPQPRKDEPPKKPESAAVAPTAAPVPTAAPAPKPAKPAHTAQPRRQQKPEHTPVVEAKPRAAEPQPVQSPVVAARAAQSADAAPTANSGEDDRPLFAKLRLVPSWFSAGNDKPADKPAERPAVERPTAEVPRPPMPVGDALRSAM